MELEQDCSLTAFRDVSIEFNAAYLSFAKACGLPDSEYWTLLLASEGVKTQHEISTRLHLSKQTLNSALKSLERKKLVSLVPSSQNRRMKIICLTEPGKRFVQERVLRVNLLERQAWQSLTESERSSLINLTKKFSGSIRSSLEQE